ncbi:MAG: hypothetical protein Q3983_04040 [Capnocytophaga sp.]|nr:hypothetical protein [Capnocytophaga sp.]
MIVILIILLLLIFYFLFQKREEHWLVFGKEHTMEYLTKGGKKFIYEQTSFGASQETVYYLFQLVYVLTQRKGFLEYKYDLYDFSYNIFRYEGTTLKIFRYQNYIYLIRSTEPMSIEEFESINPYKPKELS